MFCAARFKVLILLQNYPIAMKPLSLGLLRSDLMLDSGICSETCVEGQITSPYCCFKQVEINTIASGFGWMGPASGMIHRSVILVPGGVKSKISAQIFLYDIFWSFIFLLYFIGFDSSNVYPNLS